MAPTKSDSASKASSTMSASKTKSGRVTKSPFVGRKGSSGGGRDDDSEDNDGFIGGRRRRKEQKMSWTEQADIDLLLFGLERKIQSSEHDAIAASFSQKPTGKSIQERLTKLRAEQLVLLKDLGIFDIDLAEAKRKKRGTKGNGKAKKVEEAKVDDEEVEGNGEGVKGAADAEMEESG